MRKIIGLKELRQNVNKYANAVIKGESFLIMRKSEPLFVISPVNEGVWEEIIDFTKMKKGGVDINDVLSRL